MKEVILFVAFVILFISVICIYGARGIVKNKVNFEIENKVVLGLKIVNFILVIFSLCLICYLRR